MIRERPSGGPRLPDTERQLAHKSTKLVYAIVFIVLSLVSRDRRGDLVNSPPSSQTGPSWPAQTVSCTVTTTVTVVPIWNPFRAGPEHRDYNQDFLRFLCPPVPLEVNCFNRIYF